MLFLRQLCSNLLCALFNGPHNDFFLRRHCASRGQRVAQCGREKNVVETLDTVCSTPLWVPKWEVVDISWSLLCTLFSISTMLFSRPPCCKGPLHKALWRHLTLHDVDVAVKKNIVETLNTTLVVAHHYAYQARERMSIPREVCYAHCFVTPQRFFLPPHCAGAGGDLSRLCTGFWHDGPS